MALVRWGRSIEYGREELETLVAGPRAVEDNLEEEEEDEEEGEGGEGEEWGGGEGEEEGGGEEEEGGGEEEKLLLLLSLLFIYSINVLSHQPSCQ